RPAPASSGRLCEVRVLRRKSWLARLLRFFSGRGVEFLFGNAEALDGRGDSRPFFLEKLLALAFEQDLTRARLHEHAQAAFHFDEVLIVEVLIGLEDGERIDPKFGRDISDGWESITFLEDTVENHMDAAVAKLAIDGLVVIPFTAHYRFHRILSREVRAAVFD